MKPTNILVFCLAMVSLASASFATGSSTSITVTEKPNIAVDGPGVIITSSSSSLTVGARETAGPDTFAIYGGPDQPTEGKFQLGDGSTPDWGGGNRLPGGDYGGGPNAWIPVDITDQPVHWHVDTHMAENLNGNGVGNRAMWSGVAVGDPLAVGWVHVPGYGDSWLDDLIYESAPVADPTQAEIVSLEFFFNYDTEPGYDYFSVEYDSGGTWTSLYTVAGSSADTAGVQQPPGVQYSTVGARAIAFASNGFGGESGDQIRIRFRFESDGAYSDQDGLWVTNSGAVQIDDITLSSSLGVAFEDFEGSSPYLFNPDKAPFVGDFADVYFRLVDIDPCRDNNTPVIGFIDYNQIVRNGPGDGGDVNTGGSTTPGVDYGIVGSWVTNYSGGLSFGQLDLANEIWSPDILWDLPGTDDDGVDVSGAFVRFSVWVDLPVTVGIFFRWQVRSALPGEDYGNWASHNFVYHGTGVPGWWQSRFDVSELLQAGPERVQLALGCWDFARTFAFPGASGRPSPVYDNAAFYKYRIGGPVLATRNIDLAQDGFPVSGSIDVSTQASRDALDIPFSMARDVNSGSVNNAPGDSVIVDVAALIPGSAMTDIRMIWALSKNPLFEDAIRSAPARTQDQNVVTGPDVWTGEVIAGVSTTSAGFVVAGQFFLDVPDVDFMYPGDILHYYFRSSDNLGFTSTLPADVSGFGSFGPAATYNRTFTVRGLPSITDSAGAQPEILILNDFGRRGGENDFLTSMQQLGYAEGIDFDTYTTQGPSSGVSNGIGSAGAHGAEAGQLAGYHHMLYFLGNLSAFSLSNGSNTFSNDKGNDIDVLEQWHAIPGVRNVAYFGNSIATSLANGSAEGFSYMNNTMGVDLVGSNVADAIGNQVTPMVIPNAAGAYGQYFGTDFIAYGACPTLNEFDWIRPLPGSEAGHYFTDTSGIAITGPLAGVGSVINPTINGLEITFPYSIMYVYDITGRAPVGLSNRTALFQEVFNLFDAGGGMSPVVSVPGQKKARLSVFPNPFNPSTVVEFTATPGSRGSVRVFNLRGELVRTLHSGEFRTVRFRWDGTDSRGAAVASGVYLVQADMEGARQTVKIALVK